MRFSLAALAAFIPGLIGSACATRSLRPSEHPSLGERLPQLGGPTAGDPAGHAALLAVAHGEDPEEPAAEEESPPGPPPQVAEGEAEEEAVPMAHHGQGKQSKHGVGRVLLLGLICVVLADMTYRVTALYFEYRRSISGFKTKGFKHYIMYSFEQWFVSTNGANAYIVIVATTVTLVLGSLLYAFVLRTNVPIALWRVFTWILDPGAAVAVPETQIEGILLGGSIGIIGVVIFGVLLTVMQDTFARYVDMLAEGRSPVMESNHVMIVGFTDETIPLILELCLAYEDVGGTAMVVFSDRYTKPEMDEQIKDADIDLRGSRVVVRCGKPYLEQDLRHVAAHTAKTIILLPDREDSKDARDALQLRTLSTLRGRGWPTNGRIVVVCSVFLNVKLFEDVGGDVTDVVLLSAFLAKLMVQFSRQAGLRSIFKSIIGFHGCEMIIQQVPERLEGIPFSEAALYYPRAVPIAVLGKLADPSPRGKLRRSSTMTTSLKSLPDSECTFCPGKDARLAAGNKLVLLAEDPSAATASEVPVQGDAIEEAVLACRSSSLPPAEARDPEVLLMLGWNELSGAVILEIDEGAPPKSKLVIMAPKDVEEREHLVERTQKRWDQKIGNVEVVHVLGDVGSRFHLEELDTPIETYSRIFIMADETAENPQQADAWSMFAAVQIREVIKDRCTNVDTSMAMVIEIKYPMSLDRCTDLMLPRAIDAAGIPSKILAMLAYDCRSAMVLEEMISDKGSARVSVRSLSVYAEELPMTSTPSGDRGSVTFFQVGAMVAAMGDILIGWSRPGDDDVEELQGEALAFRNTMSAHLAKMQKDKMRSWEVNPGDKSACRLWDFKDDRVVVLTLSKQDDPHDSHGRQLSA